MGSVIGLDIGATKTLGVVVDATGAIRAEVRRPTTPGRDGVVATAVRVVAALREQTGEPLESAVGVGVPGLVDLDAGVVRHAVNLGLGGEPLPLRELLAAALLTDDTVENDVNAATLGAVATSGHDDVVYLSIGTGLAAGIAFGGVLRRGVHGAAGEIGHVPVDPAGPACSCGQIGCLETIASGGALALAWPASGDYPAEELFAAAADGQEKAIAVRDRFAAGVAAAVRMLALATDPEIVVLGGGVSSLGDPLRVAVEAALGDQAAVSPFLASLDLAGRLRLQPAGVPVAALGAALLVAP